ncbi:hypothetical protein VQL36_05745 [Chengkuizengella sp. SCS-71B]|uniref:hypothetical protein n=1 Tax=Chengkuizengella sp. SCS-71B TaxID=3115290 RepID=UPI0032C24611
MSFKKEPFIVCDQSTQSKSLDPDTEITVLTVEVCVPQPQITQVKLDSTVEIIRIPSTTFFFSQVDYRLYKNGMTLASQSDIASQDLTVILPVNTIDALTWCDNNPDPGLNIYEIRMERITNDEANISSVEARTRGLNASVLFLK